MKAAGYIRVSTSGQLDNTSLENQAEQITEYCQLNNLELLPIYNEGAGSGGDDDRSEFQRLMADARLQKFQFIVVREFGRFGRDLPDVLYYEKILKSFGVKLISLKQQFNDDPYGQAMKQMSGVFDELERKIIKERLHGGRNKLWKEKKSFIGHLPFGYCWILEAKKIILVDEEAKLYKQMVEDFMDRDLSMHAIAKKLNDQHRLSRTGKKWATASISAIFAHTIYYGYLVSNQFL